MTFLRLGLIGYPLSHSLSPRLHAAALRSLGWKGEYRLYPIPPEDGQGLASLIERLRGAELHGLNVTIPHKQSVLPFVDRLSPAAARIGAVNTLCFRDGCLVGENTDAPGFLADRAAGPCPQGDGLVLGAGGAARAVVQALLANGRRVVVAARRADTQQAAELVRDLAGEGETGALASVPLEAPALTPLLDGTGLIVNATPVGMFPDVDRSPWPEGLPFPPQAAVYDLVYNPRETFFARQAERAGLPARTGLGMLVEQARLSFEIWTGRLPGRDSLFCAVEDV